MGLSSPKIKKVFIFSQKSFFLYFRKRNFFKKLLIFQKETSELKKKKKNGSENFFYIFSKKVCLIFWETKLSYILLKRVLCLSEKERFISKKLNKIFLYSE